MKMNRKVVTITLLLVLLGLWQASPVGATILPPTDPGAITVHKFNDANGNGTQDASEGDIAGWLMRIYRADHTGLYLVGEGYTGADGTVVFADLVSTTYKVWEEKLECWEPTTPEGLSLWSHDEHEGYYTRVFPGPGESITVEFGNMNTCQPPPPAPGTGTPGYWKNHPEAWPVEEITVGGVTYTVDEAIGTIQTAGKGDKTYTLFRALVAAKLNVAVGNDASCIEDALLSADGWMATYGPAGSGVKGGGKSSPWRDAEPLYSALDAYNNGVLCAPSRDVLE